MCVAICTMRDTPPTVHQAFLVFVFGVLIGGMVWDQHAMTSVVEYTQANSVTLYDALGRRLVLPLELCDSDLVSTAIYLVVCKRLRA